jgi:ABC-2 type transport system permease protein
MSVQPPTWTRTFAWLLRRELWEHRFVWITPLAVAAFAAFAHLMTALFIPDAERDATLADPKQAAAFMDLYGAATFLIIASGWVTTVLYCLEALQGERRDRSILFWKSLPVSDRLTVLSKAFVALAVIPAAVFGAVLAATSVMVVLQTLVWQLDGFDPRQLWSRLDLPFLWLTLIYGLPFVTLWNAPLIGWMLVVSAWARRVAFLWALAPIAAVLFLEGLAFARRGQPLQGPLTARLIDSFAAPYTVGGERKVWIDRLADLDPLRLYTHPGLWLGLIVAALLLWAAARLRRSRAPL